MTKEQTLRTMEEIQKMLSRLEKDREDEDLQEGWEELDAQIDILKWVLGAEVILY